MKRAARGLPFPLASALARKGEGRMHDLLIMRPASWRAALDRFARYKAESGLHHPALSVVRPGVSVTFESIAIAA